MGGDLWVDWGEMLEIGQRPGGDVRRLGGGEIWGRDEEGRKGDESRG